MQWHYATNGQRLGPVPHEELERLIQSGTVTGDTLLWRQGMDQWKTLDDVRTRDPAMFALAPPPLPGADAAAANVNANAEAEPVRTTTRRPMRLELDEEKPVAPEILLYAGFWRRAGAYLVDFIIWLMSWTIVVNIMVALFFQEFVKLNQKIQAAGGAFAYKPTPEEAAIIMDAVVPVLLAGVACALIYDLIFLLRLSATPGKLLFGLRVVRGNNKPLGFGRIVARFLAKGLSGVPTFGIGFLIAAFDDQKRGLHDLLCNTRVVTKRKE